MRQLIFQCLTLIKWYHADNIAKLEEGGELPDEQHPKDLFFRVDHQTFRKLPRTKGIIFGVYVSISQT